MNLTYQSLAAIVPIYAMILTGLLARKLDWLKPEADSTIIRIAIDVTLPCFIIYNMLGNQKLASVGFALSTIFLGAAGVGIALLISWIIAKYMKLKVGDGLRTFVVTTGVQNYGFFIIALVAILYTGTDNEMLGLVLTHNVGCDLVFWTVCLFLISNDSKFSFRSILRGPVCAVFISLILIWTNTGKYVPDFVLNSLKMIGGCAIPLNLFMFGALIVDMYGHAKVNIKLVTMGVVARMMIMPIVFIAFAVLLPIDLSLKKLIVFQALPPCGVTAAVLTKHFGGDSSLSVHITLVTCIVAIFTLPLWMNIGFGLIE